MDRTLLLVIGAMKAGSTSAFDYLTASLDCEPVAKERSLLDPDRFSAEEAIAAYRPLFARRDLVLEVSTRYAMAPFVAGVPERASQVASALGASLHVAYLVREPVNRLMSHIAHDARRGVKVRSADHAMVANGRYILFGLYGAQISMWTEIELSSPPLVLEVSQLSDGHVERMIGQSRRLPEVSEQTPHSNPSSSDADMNRPLATALSSRLYTEAIRPLVPDAIKRAAKSLLKNKNAKPVEWPSPAVDRFLRHSFDADCAVLASLDAQGSISDVSSSSSWMRSTTRSVPEDLDMDVE